MFEIYMQKESGRSGRYLNVDICSLKALTVRIAQWRRNMSIELNTVMSRKRRAAAMGRSDAAVALPSAGAVAAIAAKLACSRFQPCTRERRVCGVAGSAAGRCECSVLHDSAR